MIRGFYFEYGSGSIVVNLSLFFWMKCGFLVSCGVFFLVSLV